MRDAGRGRATVVEALDGALQTGRVDTHLLGERAVHPGADHPVADCEIRDTVGGLGHHPGELTARQNGTGTVAWYLSATSNTSGKFTAAAPTRTRT